MVGLAFAVLGCLLLVVWAQLRATRKNPRELDLDSVRDAMIEKHGWSLERANAAEQEYVRFLTLLKMRPGFMLVPWLDGEGRDDLDQFWHQHILDTAKYAADCRAVFGRMIHHNPHLVRGSNEETDSVNKTRRLYARRFKSGAFGRKADPEDATSCSTCGAVLTISDHHGDGSHGHGSSDGHGGDGGGHGCGGHGCGGHGCGGGGCGGH